MSFMSRSDFVCLVAQRVGMEDRTNIRVAVTASRCVRVHTYMLLHFQQRCFRVLVLRYLQHGTHHTVWQ